MAVITIPEPLKEKLGIDASNALIELLNEINNNNKEEIIELSDEKFARKLTEELSILRSTDLVNLDSRITEEIAKLDNRINEKTAMINNRIDEKTAMLNNRIDEKTGKLDNLINEKTANLDNLINEKIAKLDNLINEKIAKLDNRLTEKTAKIKTDIVLIKWMMGVVLAGIISLILNAFFV